MKRVYFVISVIAFIACLMGIPYLVNGISARGMSGINYGRIIFPLLISGVFFILYKRKK